MNKRQLCIIFLLIPLLIQAQKYTPDWESLDQHPTPNWYSEARFGIIIHWGLFSVPSYAPITEGTTNSTAWYYPEIMAKPWKSTWHKDHYENITSYKDFLPFYKAEKWDPRQWAELMQRSGAKYVLLTAKHHDGFCLWPTKTPGAQDYHSLSGGPHRDLTGDFAQSCKRLGLKFGVYYSLLEWDKTPTLWPFSDERAIERTGHYIPHQWLRDTVFEHGAYAGYIKTQIEELIRSYSPDYLYFDGAWDHPDTTFNMPELMSWLYNSAPNKRTILVNDRTGSNTPGLHGDVFTTPYESSFYGLSDTWESNCKISNTYGYNSEETLSDYKSTRDIITELCNTVSKGGNFLLHIGARADGSIPLLVQERLIEVGKWVETNQKAIYKTEAFKLKDSQYSFTKTRDKLYIFMNEWKQGSIRIVLPEEIQIKNCILLGLDQKIVWKKNGTSLLIIPPVISPENKDVRHVYVFELSLEPKN